MTLLFAAGDAGVSQMNTLKLSPSIGSTASDVVLALDLHGEPVVASVASTVTRMQ